MALSPRSPGEELASLAHLLRERNLIDEQIGELLGRPMTSGHAGEWIASRIFDIELEVSASATAIDGHFRTGALAGMSVNVKWYLKREGLLDMTTSHLLDFYLVLTGPKASPGDSRVLRPWVIESVYLFEASRLLSEQAARNVKVGVASSITAAQWAAAEVYPRSANSTLELTHAQRAQLALFAR